MDFGKLPVLFWERMVTIINTPQLLYMCSSDQAKIASDRLIVLKTHT